MTHGTSQVNQSGFFPDQTTEHVFGLITPHVHAPLK